MKALKLIASLALTYSAATIGSLATTTNINSWYADLTKPILNPPNWVFGPVWTILYGLIGVSFYLLWTTQATYSKARAYIVFFVQLILNASWSIVFFGLHLFVPAIIIVLALLMTIIGMIVTYRKFSNWSAYLLLPYAVWVSFASYLTIAIALLNS